MSVASATKDQMKVWKSALKPDPDSPSKLAAVMLEVIKAPDGVGYIARLSGSDAYQVVVRNIQTEDDASGEAPLQVSVPRDAMEAAEKAMHKSDRAFFDDGKITVRAVILDEDTGIESTVVRAVIPYSEQLDMFSDYLSMVEKVAKEDIPEKTVTVNAKLLKKVVEQLKHGDATVTVQITMKADNQPLIITAFGESPDEAITAVVMPLKV